MTNKLVEKICPMCKETRTVQRKNKYDNSLEKPCRPCVLVQTKKYFGKTMFRKS